MAVNQDYEVSTPGAERKWAVPYSRLEDTTPEAGHAAMLLSRTQGVQVGGIVLVTDADRARAVIDFTPGKIYDLQVRNVLTYAANVEATFGAINIGDPIYYDRSSTMPAGVELSTSPLDRLGNANALWGYVQEKDITDEALYPKGGAGASTQQCGVMARGAGA